MKLKNLLNKKIIVQSILILLIHTSGFSQERSLYLDIYFGGGYKNDSISVSVNDVNVIKNSRISSMLSLGLSGVWLKGINSKNHIYILNSDNQVFKIKMKKSIIKILIIFRGEIYNFDIKPNDGAYLVFTYGIGNRINLEQYKHAPSFG